MLSENVIDARKFSSLDFSNGSFIVIGHFRKNVRQFLIWFCKKILARYDYEIKKRETISIDVEAALAVRDSHLYSQYSPGGPRFCSWLGSQEFQKSMKVVWRNIRFSPPTAVIA